MVNFLRRASDDPHQKNLSKTEKHAQILIENKRFAEAAKLYESSNMHRQAIDVLERHGFVVEAAAVLVRMGKHHRAGALLTRHRRPLDATQAYIKGGHYLEAGCAARSAGKFKLAADCFIRARRLTPAAQCFLKAKMYLPAAHCFASTSDFNASMKCYQAWLQGNPKNPREQLDNEDRKAIVILIKEGLISKALLYLIENSDELTTAIVHFLNCENYKALALLLKYCQESSLEKVAMDLDHASKIAVSFAQVLESSKQYRVSGLLYEKLKHHKKAASCFEKAGLLVRAITLYNKVGELQKAVDLRSSMGKDSSNTTTLRTPKASNIFKKNPHTSILGTVTPRKPPPIPQPKAKKAPTSPKPQKRTPPKAPEVKPPKSSAPAKKKPIKKALKESTQVVSIQSSPTSQPPPKPFYLSNLFMDLNRAECDQFWNFGRTRSFAAKDVVISRTKKLHEFCILLSGTLKDEESPEAKIIKPSASFGEFSILVGQSHPHHLVAQEDGELFSINQEEFHSFAHHHGPLVQKIYRYYMNNMIKRIKQLENVTAKKSLKAS